MIDFIDVIIRLQHDGQVNNGYKISVKKDSTENTRFYEKEVIGESNGVISVVSENNNELRITGSPLMFLQGQNVFGTNNLKALVHQVALDTARQLGIKPTKADIQSWKKGLFSVIRLDVTYNFLIPSRESVVDWLTEAGSSVGTGKQRVDLIRSSSSQLVETIMVGKSSCFNSVKFYDKYRQLLSKKGMLKIANTNPVMGQLLANTRQLLRCEIRFNRNYLVKHKLTQGKDLTPAVLRKIFFDKLKAVHLGTGAILPKAEVDNLTKSERLVYKLWLQGGSIKELVLNGELSESTIARLNQKLKPFGINIRRKFVKQVSGQELADFIKPENIARIPAFLKGTRWLFQP